LVVVEPVRLLAGVALRGRVALVAPQPDQVAPALAAQLDLEAAVALAEDAGGGLPGGRRHGRNMDQPGRLRRRDAPAPKGLSGCTEPGDGRRREGGGRA